MSSGSSPGVIRIAAAVVVDDHGRTLVVRKRGTQAFMQPGGKVADGETALEALAREVGEELGCRIAAPHRPLGRFSAVAANEAGHVVEAELFAVDLVGDLQIAAEIEEMVWHDPSDLTSLPLAPLTRDHVLPLLRSDARAA
jgi:8-oxo-dGTP diphosphatase